MASSLESQPQKTAVLTAYLLSRVTPTYYNDGRRCMLLWLVSPRKYRAKISPPDSQLFAKLRVVFTNKPRGTGKITTL